GGENTTARADIAGVRPVNLSVTGLKEVASEIDIIYSSDTLRRALQTVGAITLFPEIAERRLLGLLPAYSPDQQMLHAEALFRARLRAAVQIDTNIIRVIFTYPDRRLAVQALQALDDAYLGHRRDVLVSYNSPFLSSELKAFTDQLKDIEGQIQRV